MCYAALLLNGIHHIVYAYEDVMGGGTSLPLDQLTPLYKGMSVKTVQGVMRAESLALLKSFFSDPRNDYLRNTLLARYTLEQP
jgi:tRNA(adenine34) deaminase